MKTFEQSDALKRLPKQFFANLVQKVNALVEKGYDVINLGQGSPDLPTPLHIVEALKEASENPLYHRYPPFQGYDFLKEAVAQFYAREYGVQIDAKHEVAILFGGKSGLVELSQCLLNEGDVALVPDPGYPDYWSGIALANAYMEMMPLKEENDFLPDYKKIDEEILDKAKLMFLNYPNNPTGAIANHEFFTETVELATKHHICVVHDFAYGGIGFDGKRPISFLEIPGAKEIGVEIYTMSKSYNMAGWRIAFAIGNRSIISSINLIQDHFHCSLFGGIQDAAAKALLGPQDCVQELVHIYESRRNTFIKGLQNIGWNVTAPKGSFFAWLPVPSGYDSVQFADLLLEKTHIAVAPGIGFGKEGENYIRVGLLATEERLLEAVTRIEQCPELKNCFNKPMKNAH